MLRFRDSKSRGSDQLIGVRDSGFVKKYKPENQKHPDQEKKFWGTTWKIFRRDALRLIVPGDRVLALVSGGPDSTAMAWWLDLLAQRYDFSWAVAHFDHGLRAGSANVARQVRGMTQFFGVRFFQKKLNVKKFVSQQKLSVEDAARKLRYQAAHDLAHRHGFNKVAAAHTLEEQAESVMLNLLRGGSVSGLQGARAQRAIVPGSPIELIRPMLGISKRQVVAFLHDQKIIYDQDPMNNDPRFLRTRIRHELLPMMVKLHPRAMEHIAGLAAKLTVK